MASEEGATAAAAAATAAIAEEVAARTRDLVRRVLRPGGPLDVEVAANQAAEGARLYVITMSRLHPVRRKDIEAVAIGSAAGFLSIIARSNQGSLNLPNDLVEAVIGNAVADAADQDIVPNRTKPMEEVAAGAGAAAAVAALLRPRPNLADRIFSFCMKASIVISICYLAFLVCLVLFASELQFEKLQLLPFFGTAIVVPLYALALLQEYGN